MISSIGYAAPFSVVNAVEVAPQVHIPAALTIPAELGSVERSFRVSSDSPFVIYIQDAHALSDAQQKIQKLIEYFQNEYGINLIALEGGKGELDSTLLRTFPDSFAKKNAVLNYVERGELGGAAAASILNETQSVYHGIEDWPLYEQNYTAYLQASEKMAPLLSAIEQIENDLDRQSLEIFKPERYEFYRHIHAFYNETENLLEFLKYIQTLLPNMIKRECNPKYEKCDRIQKRSQASDALKVQFRSVFPNQYPQLSVFFDSLILDGKSENEDPDMFIRKLAVDFRKKYFDRLDPTVAFEFTQKHQAYVTGELGQGEFLKFLVQTGERIGLRPKLTPALKALIGRTDSLATIKGTALFEELECLIGHVDHKISMPSSEEMEIIERFKKIRILKDLARLELSRPELTEYQQDAEGYLETLGEHRDEVLPALQFYDFALKRDQAFHKNLATLIERKKAGAAVVVTGGFHAEGFEESLKEAGFSYAVVVPKIDSLEGREFYGEVMHARTSYQDYLKTTFYDGFMRHAAVELVSGMNADDFRKNLKLWRDEVIRKLAGENRLTEASRYTRYIDRLIKIYHERFSDRKSTTVSPEEIISAVEKELDQFRDQTTGDLWNHFQTKLDSLSQGLKSLIEQGDLNLEKVRNLLENPVQMNPTALSWIQPLDPTIPAGSPVTRFARGETNAFPVSPAVLSSPVEFVDSGSLRQKLIDSLSEGFVRPENVRSAVIQAQTIIQSEMDSLTEQTALLNTAELRRGEPSAKFVEKFQTELINRVMRETGLSEEQARRVVYVALTGDTLGVAKSTGVESQEPAKAQRPEMRTGEMGFLTDEMIKLEEKTRLENGSERVLTPGRNQSLKLKAGDIIRINNSYHQVLAVSKDGGVVLYSGSRDTENGHVIGYSPARLGEGVELTELGSGLKLSFRNNLLVLTNKNHPESVEVIKVKNEDFETSRQIQTHKMQSKEVAPVVERRNRAQLGENQDLIQTSLEVGDVIGIANYRLKILSADEDGISVFIENSSTQTSPASGFRFIPWDKTESQEYSSITIGRSAQSELILNSGAVTRNHAQILRQSSDGRLQLLDDHSKAGTTRYSAKAASKATPRDSVPPAVQTPRPSESVVNEQIRSWTSPLRKRLQKILPGYDLQVTPSDRAGQVIVTVTVPEAVDKSVENPEAGTYSFEVSSTDPELDFMIHFLQQNIILSNRINWPLLGMVTGLNLLGLGLSFVVSYTFFSMPDPNQFFNYFITVMFLAMNISVGIGSFAWLYGRGTTISDFKSFVNPERLQIRRQVNDFVIRQQSYQRRQVLAQAGAAMEEAFSGTNLDGFGAVEQTLAEVDFDELENVEVNIDDPAIFILPNRYGRRNPDFYNPQYGGWTDIDGKSSPMNEVFKAVQAVLSMPQIQTLLKELLPDRDFSETYTRNLKALNGILDNDAIAHFFYVIQHVLHEDKTDSLRETVYAYFLDMIQHLGIADVSSLGAETNEQELGRKYAQFARRDRPFSKPAILHREKAADVQFAVSDRPQDFGAETFVIEPQGFQLGQGRKVEVEEEEKIDLGPQKRKVRVTRLQPEKILFARWKGRRFFLYVSRSHTTATRDGKGGIVHTWRQSEGFLGGYGWIIKSNVENMDDLPVDFALKLDQIIHPEAGQITFVQDQQAFNHRLEANGLLNFVQTEDLEKIYGAQNQRQLQEAIEGIRTGFAGEESFENPQIRDAIAQKRAELRSQRSEARADYLITSVVSQSLAPAPVPKGVSKLQSQWRTLFFGFEQDGHKGSGFLEKHLDKGWVLHVSWLDASSDQDNHSDINQEVLDQNEYLLETNTRHLAMAMPLFEALSVFAPFRIELKDYSPYWKELIDLLPDHIRQIIRDQKIPRNRFTPQSLESALRMVLPEITADQRQFIRETGFYPGDTVSDEVSREALEHYGLVSNKLENLFGTGDIPDEFSEAFTDGVRARLSGNFDYGDAKVRSLSIRPVQSPPEAVDPWLYGFETAHFRHLELWVTLENEAEFMLEISGDYNVEPAVVLPYVTEEDDRYAEFTPERFSWLINAIHENPELNKIVLNELYEYPQQWEATLEVEGLPDDWYRALREGLKQQAELRSEETSPHGSLLPSFSIEKRPEMRSENRGPAAEAVERAIAVLQARIPEINDFIENHIQSLSEGETHSIMPEIHSFYQALFKEIAEAGAGVEEFDALLADLNAGDFSQGVVMRHLARIFYDQGQMLVFGIRAVRYQNKNIDDIPLLAVHPIQGELPVNFTFGNHNLKFLGIFIQDPVVDDFITSRGNGSGVLAYPHFGLSVDGITPIVMKKQNILNQLLFYYQIRREIAVNGNIPESLRSNNDVINQAMIQVLKNIWPDEIFARFIDDPQAFAQQYYQSYELQILIHESFHLFVPVTPEEIPTYLIEIAAFPKLMWIRFYDILRQGFTRTGEGSIPHAQARDYILGDFLPSLFEEHAPGTLSDNPEDIPEEIHRGAAVRNEEGYSTALFLALPHINPQALQRHAGNKLIEIINMVHPGFDGTIPDENRPSELRSKQEVWTRVGITPEKQEFLEAAEIYLKELVSKYPQTQDGKADGDIVWYLSGSLAFLALFLADNQQMEVLEPDNFSGMQTGNFVQISDQALGDASGFIRQIGDLDGTLTGVQHTLPGLNNLTKGGANLAAISSLPVDENQKAKVRKLFKYELDFLPGDPGEYSPGIGQFLRIRLGEQMIYLESSEIQLFHKFVAIGSGFFRSDKFAKLISDADYLASFVDHAVPDFDLGRMIYDTTTASRLARREDAFGALFSYDPFPQFYFPYDDPRILDWHQGKGRELLDQIYATDPNHGYVDQVAEHYPNARIWGMAIMDILAALKSDRDKSKVEEFIVQHWSKIEAWSIVTDSRRNRNTLANHLKQHPQLVRNILAGRELEIAEVLAMSVDELENYLRSAPHFFRLIFDQSATLDEPAPDLTDFDLMPRIYAQEVLHALLLLDGGKIEEQLEYLDRILSERDWKDILRDKLITKENTENQTTFNLALENLAKQDRPELRTLPEHSILDAERVPQTNWLPGAEQVFADTENVGVDAARVTIWTPQAEQKRAAFERTLAVILQNAVINELQGLPNAEAVIAKLQDQNFFSIEALSRRLGDGVQELDVEELLDGIQTAALQRFLIGFGTEDVKLIDGLGVQPENIPAIKFLLNPAHYDILAAAFKRQYGHDLQFHQVRQFAFDGMFADEDSYAGLSAVIQSFDRTGVFYLRGDETRNSVLARILRMPGIIPLSRKPGEGYAQLRGLRANPFVVVEKGIPVEFTADKDQGFRVSRNLFLQSELVGPEFLTAVLLAREIEEIQRLVEAESGLEEGLPEFSLNVFRAVMFELNQLAQQEQVRNEIRRAA
ncbi:MAG: hypothetical protein H6757_03045 [Candidatus Omnitrophica bacterium]|nr:hypothetical protein [Candidatus Omnitrophota bacterium]